MQKAKSIYQFKSQVQQNQDKQKQIMDKMILKLLQSVENILDESAISLLKFRYQAQKISKKQLKFIEFFAQYLIEQLQIFLKGKIQHISSRTKQAMIEDYEILQEAIQKTEAEIRKHIRIEQQCKICIDNLEQKVQSLENQLVDEQNKNSRLLQKIKQLERDNRRFEEEFKSMDKHNKNRQSNNDMKSHMNKQIFLNWKYKRSNARINNEKIKSKAGNKSSEKKLQIIDNQGQIKVGYRPESRVENFKNSMNAFPNFKQLTKTVQMKEANIDKSKLLKNKKHKTEKSSQSNIKINRSTSICY